MRTTEAFPPLQLDLALRRAGPQTYEVYFRNDLLWASRDIAAETPDQALEIAQKLVTENLHSLDFEYYEPSDCEVAEIEVCDDEGTSLALWRDGDLHLRMAAYDLLEAAKAVIERWETGDLSEAVRNLAAAVKTATGGAP